MSAATLAAQYEPELPAEIQAEIASFVADMWRAGDLRFLLQEHQVPTYDDFHAWNKQRQTKAHKARNRKNGGRYHRIMLWEIGRRWGKTALALILAIEEMIRRPGARGMIFTPKQKNIGGIILPLIREIFSQPGKAPPEDYMPVYRQSIQGEHEGIYIPATGSFCKLVGVDMHPDATRGQFLDFCIGTEAAFVKDLAKLWRGTITAQFMHRPWGWCLLESSTAKQPDCDFNKTFRDDAQVREFDAVSPANDNARRHPYRLFTIEDNTRLSEEEIEDELDNAGGREHPDARREFFCEEVRDPEGTVVPEFDAPLKARPHTRHVVPAGSLLPQYARCYVGMDPGFRDLLGLVFVVHDWLHGRLIVVADFAKQNAGNQQVADFIRETEQRLWYTGHRAPKAKHVPLMSVLDTTPTVGGLLWEVPAPALTYWDGEGFQPNPYRRVSDVGPQFVSELATQHSINFQGTAKDDPETQLRVVRQLFQEDKIVIWDSCTHLIQQLRSGVWNEQRTDWERSKLLGHLDCLAALIYLVRNVDWSLNPNPPARIETALHGVALPLGIDKDAALGRERAPDPKFAQRTADKAWR